MAANRAADGILVANIQRNWLCHRSPDQLIHAIRAGFCLCLVGIRQRDLEPHQTAPNHKPPLPLRPAPSTMYEKAMAMYLSENWVP